MLGRCYIYGVRMKDLYIEAIGRWPTLPSIDPRRGHGFRGGLDARCASCGWPDYHPFHILRGRPFPKNGDSVRLLSHPSRHARPYFPRTVRAGMEGVVIDTHCDNGRPERMAKVYFHDATANAIAWVTAGTLLVL